MPSHRQAVSVVRNHMNRLFHIQLLLTISISCCGQKTIEQYKTLFDQYMSTELDSTLLRQIRCKSYMAKGPNDTIRYAGDYMTNKNTVLNDLDWIGFFYGYFSKELNYEFHFYLTLGVQRNFIGPKTMLSEKFPECIRDNSTCSLISKDSAVKIARVNGIKYPDNVYVDLVKPKKSNDFFWAINSQDSTQVNYNKPMPDGLDYPILPWKQANTRLINAVTGKGIPLKDYYLLDK